jgi:hypothetical protein
VVKLEGVRSKTATWNPGCRFGVRQATDCNQSSSVADGGKITKVMCLKAS